MIEVQKIWSRRNVIEEQKDVIKYKKCDNDIEIWNLWVEYKNSLGYKKYKLNIKYEEYL